MSDSISRHLEVRTFDARTIVTFKQAQLDDRAVRALDADLDRLAERHSGGELHLDFQHVEFLSSAGLGKVVALHQRIAAAGGRLALINLGSFVYELFEVTHLASLLDVRRAVDDGASVPPEPRTSES